MSAPGTGQLFRDGAWRQLTVTCGAAAVPFAANPILAAQILMQNNSDTPITWGADSDADFHSLDPLAGYALSVPGKLFDLSTLYAHAGGVTKELQILYCD